MPDPAADLATVLEQALACIAFNAESWHGDNEAKGRALTVIAQWARDPASIPEGVARSVSAGHAGEQE